MVGKRDFDPSKNRVLQKSTDSSSKEESHDWPLVGSGIQT